MTEFQDLALQYMLADDEGEQKEIAKKAAAGIERTGATRTTVGSWASCIQKWMPSGNSGDGDAAMDSDLITRAKAMSFLSTTLEYLDPQLLKKDQVSLLVDYFGSIFSLDHKAGISASSNALRYLQCMKGFSAEMGVKAIEDICKLNEDFRLQTTATRLGIYELFLSLLQHESVASGLRGKSGPSCGFAIDMIRMCRNEKDASSLLRWFAVLEKILQSYHPSLEVTREIFETFTAYFPISLRSSTEEMAVTADDLKLALRRCFAAHQRLASMAFPYLIQKLGQGDAVTVSVKVDILRTMQACIDRYADPEVAVLPHVDSIWASLKYEVRNGEVKESIDATLEALRSIARRLRGAALSEYIHLVFRDCNDDLSNPVYTNQAGLLLMTVVTSNVQAYLHANSSLVDSIRQNLGQPKSPVHRRKLVLLLNSVLKARTELMGRATDGSSDDDVLGLQQESYEYLRSLNEEVYSSIWTSQDAMSSDDTETLKQVVQGYCLLSCQEVLRPDGQKALLMTADDIREVCVRLVDVLTSRLEQSRNELRENQSSLREEITKGLHLVVISHPEAFYKIVGQAKSAILRRDWTAPAECSLHALKEIMFQLAFIGCSEIPRLQKTEKPLLGLQLFIVLVSSLVDLFPISVRTDRCEKTEGNERPQRSHVATAHVVAAIHCAILSSLDAHVAACQHEANIPLGSMHSWFAKLASLPEGWLQQAANDAARLEGIFEQPAAGAGAACSHGIFLGLCLYMARHIFRKCTSGGSVRWSEEVMVQSGNLAASVVRELDESSQVDCRLGFEAFNLFADPGQRPVKDGCEPVIQDHLTLGVLQGLWPGAMLGLFEADGSAEKFMCVGGRLGPASDEAGTIPDRIMPGLLQVRASIASVLANKYRSLSASSSQSWTMERVLSSWGERIREAATGRMDPVRAEHVYNMAFHTMAGAAARLDKNILSLVPVLHEVMFNQGSEADVAVRMVGILVKADRCLVAENHAIVKPLSKQWVYAHFVKPLYKNSSANGSEHVQSDRSAAFITSIVAHCPFAVYQDDLEPLLRVLIIKLNDRPPVSVLELETLSGSLQILMDVLSNAPDAVKGHLKAIISGSLNVYHHALSSWQTKASIRQDDSHAAARCRIQALELLRTLARKLEGDRGLRHNVPRLLRVLGPACGDPVRGVRRTARLARKEWEKVAAA